MRKSLVYFTCLLIVIFSAVIQENGESTTFKNQVSANILLPIFESVSLDSVNSNSGHGFEYQQVQFEIEHNQTLENQLEAEFTVPEN